MSQRLPVERPLPVQYQLEGLLLLSAGAATRRSNGRYLSDSASLNPNSPKTPANDRFNQRITSGRAIT